MTALTFYVTVARGWMRPEFPAIPVMVSAASYFDGRFHRPSIPSHIPEVAADCGGFIAARVWGDYRFDRAAYSTWLETVRPSWAATFDWCCEDEVTSGRPGIVRERQQRTTEAAWAFADGPSVPWLWVPTVQGWQVDDYLRHAEELAPLLARLARRYIGRPWRVGVGSLCRRVSARRIHAIVNAVASVLPGVPLHLWGVKLAFFTHDSLNQAVASFDSAAWNRLFGTNIERWRRSAQSLRLWAATTALPEYLGLVADAIGRPKQLPLGLMP